MFIVFIFISLLIFAYFLIKFIVILGYTPIIADGLNHYLWLPQTFIFHDYSLKFLYDILPLSMIDQHLSQGFIKFPLGSAYLMSPFFFIAHFCTKLINIKYANGFTFIYQLSMWFSAVFYWLTGIILSYKILNRYTDKKNSVLTCFIITFGAGLFIYTICYSAFAHVYSFFAISLFIYLIIKFKGVLDNEKTSLQSFLTGLNLGLITAIKNMNVLIFIIYIFYNTSDFNSFKQRIIKFLKPKNLIPFIMGFFTPLIPLFCYWYYKTGHIIINSYRPEKYMNIDVSKSEPWLCTFNYLHPHLLSAMFSFKKGLFIYYPVLIFAIIGLFFIRKTCKDFKYAIPIFTLTMIYLLSSFNYWWAGHSFGLRFYIDYLLIFAILIVSFLEQIKKSKFKYYLSVSIMILLTVFSAYMGYLVYIGYGNQFGSLF